MPAWTLAAWAASGSPSSEQPGNIVAETRTAAHPKPAQPNGGRKPTQASTGPKPADQKSALVDAAALVPGLITDLRYATSDNFLHRRLYPIGARCMLLKPTVERLVKAAELLRTKGFRLKVYDCYRPHSVQWEMWKVLPQPGYVADPRKGSNHNRGAAVDLTLATLEGGDVEMPTPFDTFSEAAHHGYPGGSAASRSHRETLGEAMEAAGFKINPMEWWHYDLPNAGQFPVLNEQLPTG